jgi:hypothetical protein
MEDGGVARKLSALSRRLSAKKNLLFCFCRKPIAFYAV